jgi:hypothetical protein
MIVPSSGNNILRRSMNEVDWALAVGVRVYPDPGLGDLSGPELDATGFHEWVVSPRGGGITDPHRVKLILSSNYTPPFSSATSARPTVEAVNEFFTELDDLATGNEKKGDGLRVGRRLYLYFSGHGFMPAATEDEIALLMANATPNRLGNHVLGRAWANLFYRSGYFREILLFMDCCRNEFSNAPLNVPFLNPSNDPQAGQKGRRLYAYATKWGRKARERKMADGQTRGVFTAALLAGLWGGAADTATHEIRASDLRSFLYQNMKEFLAPEDFNNDEIPKEPDFYPSANDADNFLIANAEPTKYPVRVSFPGSIAGSKINIRSGVIRDGIEFKILETATAAGTEWDIPLPRGLYLAEIVGGPEAKPFEVKHPRVSEGDGVKHVEF